MSFQGCTILTGETPLGRAALSNLIRVLGCSLGLQLAHGLVGLNPAAHCVVNRGESEEAVVPPSRVTKGIQCRRKLAPCQ
jgi:hypothetical protein